MITIFVKLEKFVKGLPIIRSVPGFNTLPTGLAPGNLRFYKLCNLVLTLGMFIHAMWVSFFIYLQVYPLACINIISVGIYIFAIVINRKGYHFTSSVIMVLEIIVHQLVAVRVFGWDAGFQYYIIVIGLFPFLMPKGKWLLKSLQLAACLLCYILMDYLLKNQTPIYTIDQRFLAFLRISNIVFSFTSMDISGAYFNIAMHETEAKLEQKTEELVQAQHKATLGKFATEMAHEIQNPLNFVNNFSELNEEMLKEIKQELEKTTISEEAKTLLDDLIQNSERITANGKRVSTIVSVLQEQVNNL